MTARASPSTRPSSPRGFSERINELLADPAGAERLGKAGRERAVESSAGRRSPSATSTLYEPCLAAA